MRLAGAAIGLDRRANMETVWKGQEIMEYRITINCENAAFEDQPGAEIARILRKLADECEEVGHPQFKGLYDFNGNKVGKVEATN